MIRLTAVKKKDKELFWNKVAAPYSPEVFHLNDEETVLLFTKKETGSKRVTPSF